MIESFLFIVVFFISNIIQAITGFTGILLAMPVSIKLIGVNDAKAILNIMGLLACLFITIQNYKYIDKKELLKITIIMFFGMIVGVALFSVAPTSMLLNIYAVMIIIIALKNLFIKKK